MKHKQAYQRDTIYLPQTPCRTTTISAEDEWSPLRAVVVGCAENSMFPSEPAHIIRATMPAEHYKQFRPGNAFPRDIIEKAQDELNHFADILRELGIKVYRPDKIDWRAFGGYTGAMPRDGLMVVGQTLIEAPFAWECRKNEIELAYSGILRELSKTGTSTISRAPQINGKDSIYTALSFGIDAEVATNGTGPSRRAWAINNSRPAFDAADFMRFGKTIIGQFSHVTNQRGVDYLRAVIPSGYKVEMLDTTDEHAMHIDATILPLRKGILVYNPERVTDEALRRHDVFKDWDLHPYPFQPRLKPTRNPPQYMVSPWIVLNALVLDETRIFVEESETEFAGWLSEEFNMEPILLPFKHVNSIGGSFHCATVDLVRELIDD